MRDPYLYRNTDILINKHNIKDLDLLSQMEAEYTSFRLKQITEKPLIGEYDFEHLCDLHRWIFQDIYDWAGEPRIINIEKDEPILGGLSVEYSDFKDIRNKAEDVLSSMKGMKWTKISLDKKASIFSDAMAKLWKIHPFREGNTRAIVTFCCQFAESLGIQINTELFEKNSVYLRSALVAANADFHDLGDMSKPEYLNKIVYDALQLQLIKGLDDEEEVEE